MTPEILLVPSGVVLVPGATGRVDAFRDDRAAVVGTLARTLAAAARRAERARCGVEVTVVAPAPVATTRTTDHGIPDLGAAGLDHTLHPELVLCDPGDLVDRGVPLHVAASVVTVLLRLAGWRGPTRTVEIGGGELVGELEGPSPWWLDPQDGDGGLSVLVFTTIGARSGRVSDAAGTSGVPDLLRRADAAVTACHLAAVARATG